MTDKDTNLGELIEVLEVSNSDDLSVNISTKKPDKIPTKTVSLFLEEMETKDTINQPFLFIILPFFTSKRQRNVNLIYDIKNAGIKFGASLSSDDFEGLQNKQPSDFEKNVFYFILNKFQDLISGGYEPEYVTFSIEDIIEYLGLKFSMKYYRKMEETLYNLQETTYKFRIRNMKKAGNIIREVYKKPLNLIKYEKLKERNIETNKMKVLYKVELDQRIIEELKIKHYSIFDRHLLGDIRKDDKAAEKIYQFLSMKRFERSEGEFRVETLATIVPLSVTTTIKKKLKSGEVREYRVSKIKQVVRRIKKAFDLLIKKGYLESYEVVPLTELNSYSFRYKFNIDNDNNCHISDYLDTPIKNRLSYRKENEVVIKKAKEVMAEIPNSVENEIEKTRKNIYFNRAYNKRARNKIIKIYNEDGEAYTVDLLKRIYVSLQRDINRTLVSYINGVTKKIKSEQKSFDFATGINSTVVKEDVISLKPVDNNEKIENYNIIEDAQIIDDNIETNKRGDDPLSSVLYELYEKLSKDEKEDIDQKAQEKYMEKTGVEELNPLLTKIFDSIKKPYIVDIMKEEKGF